MHEILQPEIIRKFFVHELLLQRHLLQQSFAAERSAVLRIVVEEHLLADDGCLFARPVLLQTGVAARKGYLHAGAVLVIVECVKSGHGVADEVVAQRSVLLDQQAVARDIGLVELDTEGEDRGIARRVAADFKITIDPVGFHVALPVEVLGRGHLLAVDDPAVGEVVHLLINHIGRDLQAVGKFDLIGPVRYEQCQIVLRVVDHGQVERLVVEVGVVAVTPAHQRRNNCQKQQFISFHRLSLLMVNPELPPSSVCRPPLSGDFPEAST